METSVLKPRRIGSVNYRLFAMLQLRWGIIGCGSIAEDLVRSFWRCHHSHQVVGAADAELCKAVGFLEEFKIRNGKAYGDFSELLQNEDVDIVFIELSNDAHVTWILKAIEAGKHVLCEKPLAINSKQVKLVVEKSQLSGRFLMESFWSRFFPTWIKIKEIIASRELGRLLVFHCNLGSGRLSNATRDLTKGECPIMSIGIYTICLALHAFNDQRPIKIDVVGGMDNVDSWANITLQFSEHQHAFLYYNSEAFSPTSCFLSFEFGQIQIPLTFWSPEKFTVIHGSIKGKTQEFSFPLNDPTRYNFTNGCGLRFQTDHVFERIRDGHNTSNIMSLDSSLILSEVLETVRKQLGVCFPQDT